MAFNLVAIAANPFNRCFFYIDCVLTDIWMPEMNGRELVAKIRSDERFAGLPVYAVTADVEEQKIFAERGFTGVLLKPLTIDKLSGLFN